MRTLVAVLLLLHGLAHLVGFLLPWRLIPAPTRGAVPPPAPNSLFGGRVLLGDAASRGLGMLWLGAAMAFVIVAVGVWRQTPWSLPALIGVAVGSLILCVVWWPTARIGALVNVVLLTALLTVATLAYRRDLRISREHALVGSSMIDTRAGPFEYATLGEGAPILVVHGTGGGWDQGLLGARGIVPFGFRLIAPSRFGYLRTPEPIDHSPAAEADAFAALLDELRVDRVAVMSFSAGTAPALQFALRHPDRVSALVLVVPAAGGITPILAEGPPAWIMNIALRHDFPMWLTMQLAPRTTYKLVGVPPSLVSALTVEEKASLDEAIAMLLPISRRSRGIINDARNQSGAEPMYPLDQVRAPAMFVAAEDDLYETLRVARHAASIIPNAEVLPFSSGGHLLLGRSNEIWPRVAAFLNELPRGEASAQTQRSAASAAVR